MTVLLILSQFVLLQYSYFVITNLEVYFNLPKFWQFLVWFEHVEKSMIAKSVDPTVQLMFNVLRHFEPMLSSIVTSAE